MELRLKNFVFYFDITNVVFSEFLSPMESASRLSTVESGILASTVGVCVLIATSFVIFIIRCVVNDLLSVNKHFLHMDTYYSINESFCIKLLVNSFLFHTKNSE